MKFFKIFLIFTLLIFLGKNSVAQYYVSPEGSDNNNGTLNHPFKTIQKAASLMIAGDTCYIMQGKYYETVNPSHNGETENRIVFTNYKNDTVIIVSGKKLCNVWEKYKKGIFKVYFPDSVIQLFVNGEKAELARYPDKEDNNMYSFNGWEEVDTEANGDVFFKKLKKPANYWNGAYCVILAGKKWVTGIGKVNSSDQNKVHCTNRSSQWNDYNPKIYLGKGYGYLINHINALDKENEWIWRNDTLYYIPPEGKDPGKQNFEIRTEIYGFNLRGKKYIELKKINFFGSSIDASNAENCVIDSCNFLYPTPFFTFANSWVRDKGGTDNYSIDHWEGKGVTISGKNNVIKNSYVANSWGDGISVGGSYNKVENCLIENCDWSATDAGAVSATGRGHSILKNTMHTSARSILIHRICDSTDIKYNDLYDCGLMCDDLGLTYSYKTNGGNSEIAYNFIHDNHAKGTASGIYLDNYDSSYIVHHNVVWNCKFAIHTNKPAVNHKIYNNTVWFCTYAMWTWGRPGTEIINQKVMNNLSDKPWNIGTGFKGNVVTDNPDFVDAIHGDFQLKGNSPAIDKGVIIKGITDGYTGKAPDAGAFEYGVKPWKAGADIE